MSLTASIPSSSISSAQVNILRLLIYYDIFNYPLTKEEIEIVHDHCGQDLNDLVKKGWIHQFGDFYSTRLDSRQVARRLEGNKKADEIMPKAIERAKFIFQFPFVRGVYISGSLSKGFLAEDGDVDFFIITSQGRLWLARTLLILFKKVFLFNSRKLFCLNYFIDEHHLEIEEKNLFTATELSTLIPICHQGIHSDFEDANNWIGNFYPKSHMRTPLMKNSSNILKRFLEFLLNNGMGEWLDKRFMKITMDHWNNKFREFQPKDFDIAMKSRTYVSKHHPQNFQDKVLQAFHAGVLKFETTHGIDLG